LKKNNYSIAIVCAILETGGAERVISTLSNYVIAYFKNIEIICWRNTSVFYAIDEKVKITMIPFESQKKSIIGQMKWFRKYIKLNSYDLVLSFLAPFNIITSLSLIGLTVPLIVAERSDPRRAPTSNFVRIIRNFSYLFADVILTQTENNKRYFSSFLQKKCNVIFNPVFLNPELLGKALTTQKTKKIVSVARLKKSKNLLLLFDAFADISRQYNDYILVIYGEGDMRSILEKRISELNLEHKIFLPGQITDIHNQILDADIFVLTSNYEGMPNALIEAMCLGLPCISTKVSGAVDLIQNQENGILVNINDKSELINAMTELLNNKTKSEQIAKQAISIYSCLNIKIIAEQWMSVILSTIEKIPK
jgi:glycosyltransferase involved in cell wall biosynthesis